MTGPDDDQTPRSAAEELARRLIGDAAKRTPRPTSRNTGSGRFRWSGPGPDVRDPKAFSDLCAQLQQGAEWAPKLTEGKLFGAWSAIVGEQIASHATPTQLTDGVLHVQAESTAWATQLRLMQTQLLEKVATALGSGVVRTLRITGPKAPSWRKGERHVKGRGPRDTYG